MRVLSKFSVADLTVTYICTVTLHHFKHCPVLVMNFNEHALLSQSCALVEILVYM